MFAARAMSCALQAFSRNTPTQTACSMLVPQNVTP